jgi:hypothetical protein
MRKLCAVISLLFGLAGCEEYVEIDTPAIGAVERDYILAFVLDISGSFTPRMFDGNGLGYKFFLRASDQYFRNRMGDHDRILISQLSAEKRTLLWEGAPLSLRRRFGDSAALRRFIEERSDPAGSRVYAALADTLDYIYELPGVSEGETEVCVLVLSDMYDTSETQQEDRQRMVNSLKRFSETNSCIGLYWVHQYCLNDCRQFLQDSGITYVIESEIVDDPSLPFAVQ